MRVDLPQYEVIHARARRERAEAVYALVIVPIARFFRSLWTAKPATAHRRAHA